MKASIDLEDLKRQARDGNRQALQRLRDLGFFSSDQARTAPIGERIPLTYHQERLWFIDEFESGHVYATRPVYHNVPLVIRLSGTVAPLLLEQSLRQLVQRHDALRMRILADDASVRQQVGPHVDVNLSIEDLVDPGGDVDDEDAIRVALVEARRPFGRSDTRLLRATLYRFSQTESMLVGTFHHLFLDRYSLHILAWELAQAYRELAGGQTSTLPSPGMQFSAYASWQRSLPEEHWESQLLYWKRQLGRHATSLVLPTLQPRPHVHTYTDARYTWEFQPALTRQVQQFSHEVDETEFVVLLAAALVLFRCYAQQDGITMGTTAPGRGSPGTQHTVGPLANLVAIRSRLDGTAGFRHLVSRTGRTWRNVLQHQDVPFDRLVRSLNPDKDMSRTALFDVLFQTVESLPTLDLATCLGKMLDTNFGYGKYDLNICLEKEADQWRGTVVYNADLFDRAFVAQMMRHYLAVLAAGLARPEQPLRDLQVLSPADRTRQLTECNGVSANYPRGESLVQLFEHQVNRRPDAIALVSGERQMTYRALDQKANRLAHYLRQHHVGPDTFVAVCLDRSLEMVISLLAVLKAGAAYLPIDPDYPLERQRFMLADARVSLLITTSDYVTDVSNDVAAIFCWDQHGAELSSLSSDRLGENVNPLQSAYCIYTSGSSGTPKGVVIDHRNVVRLIRNDRHPFRFSAGDVWTMFHSFAFDFSVWEMYGALLYGGKLIVVTGLLARDTEHFISLLQREGVTVLNQTPTAFLNFAQQSLHRTPPRFALRHVIFGGEALDPPLLARWQDTFREVKLINMYGITETTVHVTYKELAAEDLRSHISNVGRPIPTTTVFILDERGQLLPAGVPGELFVGGEGVTRGYLQRPSLTAERFMPDPFSRHPGSVLYRSGDLGAYLPSGDIQYLGRCDQQVKIRGYRIEPGEVEAALSGCPGIRQAVVVQRDDVSGGNRLVAYLAGNRQQIPPPHELRATLKQKLPDYMVPAAMVVLESLPLTTHGKIDRRRLPDPGVAHHEATGGGPQSPTQEILAGIWSEVLGVPSVGIHDDFFELGGHSLLATSVVSRIRSAFQREVSLQQLFDNPRLADLAQQLDAESGLSVEPAGRDDVSAGDHSGPMPLSYAQERLWLADQFASHSDVYHNPVAIRSAGYLDSQAVERALHEIVQRHEVLRSSFSVVAGEPRQTVRPPASLPLRIVDLTALGASDREAQLRQLVALHVHRPLDPARGLLFHVSLIRLGPRDHALVMVMHHLASDGWSLGILMGEFSAGYTAIVRGQPLDLPALPLQYADFAHWQRTDLQGDVLARLLAFWRQQLRPPQPVLRLPLQGARIATESLHTANITTLLSADTSEQLRGLSRSSGVTLFMSLLTAFKSVLLPYADGPEVSVGTDFAQRNHPSWELLIGFFVNLLVLRTDLGGDLTFRELLARVRRTALAAYAHQDLPFGRLVQELQPARHRDRTPFFQVLFVLQNATQETLKLPGLTLHVLPTENTRARYDLAVFAAESDGQIKMTWQYKTELFRADTIARMAEAYQSAIDALIARPDQRLSEWLTSQTDTNMTDAPKRPPAVGLDRLRQLKAARPAAIDVQEDKLVTFADLCEGRPLPGLGQPSSKDVDLAAWLANHRAVMEGELAVRGALLFRGFGVDTVSRFEPVALAVCPDVFRENSEHVQESTSGNVQTPVFYPPEKKILWHNENTFNHDVPMKIIFCCVTPARNGGETPLVDSRRVWQRVTPDVRRRFAELGIMYVRNYWPGLGLSWQTIFRTEERQVVEQRCRQARIDFEWLPGDRLRTRSVRPALMKHPVTQEMSWLNQAQHWHIRCLDEETRQTVISSYASEDYPRHCYFGDGSPIEDAVMEAILHIYQEEEVSFRWQRGDVLIVDNIMTAHARNPFGGERKILVSMGQMVGLGAGPNS